MRRQRHCWRALCAVCLVGLTALARVATAQTEIIPSNPKPSDEISIRLSGTWSNACVPESPRVWLAGNRVRISTSSSRGSCAEVLTPWKMTVSIGKLPTGLYDVTVTCDGRPLREFSFTVGGDPSGTDRVFIQITPPQPTPDDPISIRLFGTWPTTCVPRNPQVALSGNRILFDTSDPGQDCDSTPTDWSLPINIGRLLAGPYQVIVRINGQEVEETGFTVAEPRALGPAIRVRPALLDFLEVPVGSTATRTLTVRNLGGTDLLISRFEILSRTSPFDPSGGSALVGAPLLPGETKTMQIKFTPPHYGFFEEALVIGSNDPATGTTSVFLRGRTPETLGWHVITDRGCGVATYRVGDPVTVSCWSAATGPDMMLISRIRLSVFVPEFPNSSQRVERVLLDQAPLRPNVVHPFQTRLDGPFGDWKVNLYVYEGEKARFVADCSFTVMKE